jgi:hypothetical protein
VIAGLPIHLAPFERQHFAVDPPTGAIRERDHRLEGVREMLQHLQPWELWKRIVIR